MEDENNGAWHLDKRVSVGHLVTSAVVLIAVITWMQHLESRLDVTDISIAFNTAMISEVKSESANRQRDIIDKLNRIEDKLDGKADK